MGGGGDSSGAYSLENTPTWALATVCFVFISLGVCIEHLIHLLCHWLKKHRKNALLEAVEKLKSVLMLLGFMSLILAVTQRPISKICVPNRVTNFMLPCRRWRGSEVAEDSSETGESSDYCTSKGMASFMSQSGINQLNNFIFVLATMQIVYSVITMVLGKAKMRHWKTWEKETQTIEYLAANDPGRFRFTRQTTFGRRHMDNCTTTFLQLWIKCFFRQFFHSVAKVDYLTLRHGFISAHLSMNNSFNFQKYIQRSLEDDFKVVVGISPLMWFMVVIFLLVDVHGWNVYLWVSFLPLVVVLFIGTKLEVIVARMALQLKDQDTVIKGAPLVRPNDTLFWFSRPQLVLTLLHYTLFTNAFEFAFFVWVTLQFGIHSCYHEHVEIIVVRVVLAVLVQVLCSYITLPLYALVTQMGSNFKSAVLEEETMHAIKKWHAGVREKKNKRREGESYHTLSPRAYSSTTCDSLATSPDVTWHHRTLTLAEFTPDGRTEVTEIHEKDDDNERKQRPTAADKDGASSVSIDSVDVNCR